MPFSWPALKTFDRVSTASSTATREGFERSYLTMRLVIGAVGVLLPLALVAVDKIFVDDPVRGSMSAYYHSSARDLFVGGLAISGFMLTTYMLTKAWTWDFLISFVGGLAVIALAGFPTARHRLGGATDSTCSYTHAETPPCTALQETLGEGVTRGVHVGATLVVIASFIALCIVFALREFGYGRAAHALVRNDPSQLGPVRIWRRLRSSGRAGGVLRYAWTEATRSTLYLGCAVGVAVGGLWGLVGPDWPGPHTYVGEFVAFTSFGTAWIVASYDLIKQIPVVNKAVVNVGQSVGVAF